MSWEWLRKLSWPALKHQAGRQLLALLAIVLGVALAYAVHLLNASALAEFGSAAASVNGRPDLVLRSRGGPLAEAVYAQAAQLAGVAIAAPVLEGVAQAVDARGERFSLRVIGWDALQSGPLNPELLPRGSATGPLALLDPRRISLNEAARQRLGGSRSEGQVLTLRAAAEIDGAVHSLDLTIAAPNAAPGGPLAVLDIAAAQVLLGRLGQVDRIDLRMEPGVSPARWLASASLPDGIAAAPPPDEGARLADVTRAYRVNLGVLSLMAMFTGSFLVFAVMSLSVAQRLPQLALLGVLGMTARERATLVLGEGLLLGLAGSALGLLLGWSLAVLGLQRLGSDLGLNGGPNLGASLHFDLAQVPAAMVFAALGVAVSLISAALPARAVRRMPVAQVLKGLGEDLHAAVPAWLGPALLLLGVALAMLPPLGDDLPLAAYASMLSLLLGGIACVPMLLKSAVSTLARLHDSPSLLLARERSRDQAGEASRALAGVLVALSLSVAMLVMVGSFRDSLQAWLTRMLPADLYIRSSLRVSPNQGAPLAAAALAAFLPASANGVVQRLSMQRSGSLLVNGSAEPATMLAREVDEQRLPLASDLASGTGVPVYVNEALRDALALRPGQALTLRQQADGKPLQAYVRAVWRDYARQSGALMLPLADYQRWSGDPQITELYAWLADGVSPQDGIARLKRLSPAARDLEFAAASELRATSLRIFDRSFAVTNWLQAVALAIGLFGIAAAQSAQVLARRREFGLLLHLGFTRGGVLRLLVLEAALMSGVGAPAGLALGLALSAVLVFVVNPQSFHWSMDMSLPWPRLASLLALMFGAGVLATLMAGRKAAQGDAVQAVKEDW